jgi:glycosyltransferase involved in cell wall biosynthesis
MIYRAIRKADLYVAYTRYEADHVISRGALPQNVEVIPLGVDPTPFRTVDPAEAKRALGLGDGRVIGFIGQLGMHKGIDVLLDAMPAVWSRMPDVRVLIAGTKTLYSTQVDARIAQYLPVFRSRVKVVYDFDEADKPLLFGALDALAYPSRHESFGIAYLEAWAAGKPVIGCRSGAVEEVVDDGRDGILVAVQDRAALANAILTLLNDARLARAMGAAGQRKVEDRHGWSEVTSRFRDAYIRVARGAQPRRASVAARLAGAEAAL